MTTIVTTKFRIQNRMLTNVLFADDKTPEGARYCEFFQDKADRLIMQTKLGKKIVIPPPYALEQLTPAGKVRRQVQ